MGIYLAVFGAVFSTVVLPIPEEAALLAAGLVAHATRARLFGCFLAAFAAILIGDLATFLVARWLLAWAARTRFGERLVPPPRREWAERLVAAHGWRSIAIGRFLVGLRTFVFLAVGAARYPIARFIAIDAVAALIDVGALVGAGYAFGSLHRRAGVWIDLAIALLVALALIAPLFQGSARGRRRP